MRLLITVIAAAWLITGCSTSQIRDIADKLPTDQIPQIPAPAEPPAPAPAPQPAPTPAPAPAPEPAPQQEFGLMWTHSGKTVRLEGWPLWASECRSITATDAAGKVITATGLTGGGQKANAVIYATLPIAPAKLTGPVRVEINNSKYGVLVFEGINPLAQEVKTIRK